MSTPSDPNGNKNQTSGLPEALSESVNSPRQNALICILAGGSMHTISVGGKLYEFEMHPYCGPTLIHKRTCTPLKHQPMPFLEAASFWAQQGQKEEDGMCVWYHKPKLKLKHLGGRHYQVMGEYPAERGS